MATQIIINEKEIERIKRNHRFSSYLTSLDIANNICDEFENSDQKPMEVIEQGNKRTMRYEFPFFNSIIQAKVNSVGNEVERITFKVSHGLR